MIGMRTILDVAEEAMRLAAQKLPLPCKMVAREGVE